MSWANYNKQKKLRSRSIGKLIEENLHNLDLLLGNPKQYYDGDKILEIILNAIRKGTIRDGYTMIQGLGRFRLRKRKAYMHSCKRGWGGPQRYKYMPEKQWIDFKIGEKIRLKYFVDKEESQADNGNSEPGTD